MFCRARSRDQPEQKIGLRPAVGSCTALAIATVGWLRPCTYLHEGRFAVPSLPTSPCTSPRATSKSKASSARVPRELRLWAPKPSMTSESREGGLGYRLHSVRGQVPSENPPTHAASP